jgi:hypothetical protein
LNPKLQRQFERLENDRIELLDKLKECPEETLAREPIAGQWSINQILSHLITSERLTLIYLKKKSLGVDQVANSGILEELKMIVLKVSQRLPFRFRAPELVVKNTPAPVSLAELVIRWNVSRIEFRDFLDTVKEENLGKLIYKHPVAGRLNVIQCVVFLREHFHHHLPQIKRALRTGP